MSIQRTKSPTKVEEPIPLPAPALEDSNHGKSGETQLVQHETSMAEGETLNDSFTISPLKEQLVHFYPMATDIEVSHEDDEMLQMQIALGEIQEKTHQT